MIEIQVLIATIYILHYSLIRVTIIAFALIIALVVINRLKKNSNLSLRLNYKMKG